MQRLIARHDPHVFPASRSTALMSPSAFTRVVLDQAHQRLQAPVVQIWDNLNTHVSHRMHALIAARPWLTVIWLPAYAPDLNPTECVWRWMKRGLTVETARTLAFQPL